MLKITQCRGEHIHIFTRKRHVAFGWHPWHGPWRPWGFSRIEEFWYLSIGPFWLTNSEG